MASRSYLAPIREETEKINERVKQIAEQNDRETDENDLINELKARVIYYVLFLENEHKPEPDPPDNAESPADNLESPADEPAELLLDIPSAEDFVKCFYEESDDEIMIIADEQEHYENIENLIKKAITEEQKERIESIFSYLTHGALPPLDFNGEYAPPLNVDIFSCITSHFGTRRDPITGAVGAFHNGTDFAFAGCYAAPIYAVADGTVTRASNVNDGFGICVVIDHGGGVLTYYAHCSAAVVKVGDMVTKGQHIAKIGSTGRSTGNHLHLGLKVNGQWQDPINLVCRVLK